MKSHALQQEDRGPELVITVPEAARRIDCTRRFLEKQIKAGHLRVIRLSRRCVRVRPEDLAEYLERRATV